MNRRRGRNPLLVFLGTFAVVLGLGAVVLMVLGGRDTEIQNPVEAIQEAATEKAVETAVQQATGTDVTLEEVKNALTPEDREKLETVIAHLSEQGVLQKALFSLAANGGDLEKTAMQLQEEVTEEDRLVLVQLYETYGDALISELTGLQ